MIEYITAEYTLVSIIFISMCILFDGFFGDEDENNHYNLMRLDIKDICSKVLSMDKEELNQFLLDTNQLDALVSISDNSHEVEFLFEHYNITFYNDVDHYTNFMSINRRKVSMSEMFVEPKSKYTIEYMHGVLMHQKFDLLIQDEKLMRQWA